MNGIALGYMHDTYVYYHDMRLTTGSKNHVQGSKVKMAETTI